MNIGACDTLPLVRASHLKAIAVMGEALSGLPNVPAI